MDDDITDTLAPKSEQMDGVDLAGNGPQVFTVTGAEVKKGAEQPVKVFFAEFPRPWRPGKNMRRVLAHCWGKRSSEWAGQRVELYYDADVKFGKETPGGIRISRISGIDARATVPIILTAGRPGAYKVDPLPAAAPLSRIDQLKNEWRAATPERRTQIEAEVAALQNGADQ